MKSRRVTVPDFRMMKQGGEKIAVLTAYDVLTARILDSCGIDAVLVGDTVGMVFSGYENTIPVELDHMIYHGKAVRRGVRNALLIIDMPFLSYQVDPEDAVRNCGRVMKETMANAVKIEGGRDVVETVRRCTRASIPVMGHIGLTPQSIHRIGGYKVQGTGKEQRRVLLEDALELQEAGCFSIVLEMVAAETARQITEKLDIPTIGIGSGPHCDGQVLVIYDMLGLNEEFKAKFFKTYADLAGVIRGAVGEYISDVRSSSFPGDEHSFHAEEE
jgi:3-methyl-2-oxobutanoate hydroxymethyltransferase